MVFILRSMLCYLVIALIVLQSTFAVAYSLVPHQEVQSTKAMLEHLDNHEEKHHNSIELAQLAANSLSDENHEHPSCDQSNHQNHCHHTSLVYIDIQSRIALPAQVKNQIQPYYVALATRVSSPSLRPPII